MRKDWTSSKHHLDPKSLDAAHMFKLFPVVYLQYKSFENTVGKGDIAGNEQFLLFAQSFLPVENFKPFSLSIKLLSGNSTVWNSLIHTIKGHHSKSLFFQDYTPFSA